MRIGEVLKSARTSQGLDIRTVEERTKIRIKYLRALEAEDWELLPGPAYAKGFLRTYARSLSLDGDALVDEFRRQVEVADRPTYGVGEPVLEHHPRPDGPSNGPGLGIALGVAAALAAAVLVVVGLTGGGDGDRDRAERREARQERRKERRKERRQERREQQAAGGPVTLRLVADAAIHVCLVGDADRPLVDGQVLPAGTEERFEARTFRLAFPSGYDVDQFRLFVDGERERLPETVGAAAYRISAPGRVRPARPPGPGCP
jgi:cytoskeleton protein RodZ